MEAEKDLSPQPGLLEASELEAAGKKKQRFVLPTVQFNAFARKLKRQCTAVFALVEETMGR